MTSDLFQIIVGAFLLSLLHASIPNHWLPLVALSKSEKWNEKSALGITAIAGFAHTLSTIIIGIIVGFMGYKLSESYSLITEVIAPVILISILLTLKRRQHLLWFLRYLFQCFSLPALRLKFIILLQANSVGKE